MRCKSRSHHIADADSFGVVFLVSETNAQMCTRAMNKRRSVLSSPFNQVQRLFYTACVTPSASAEFTVLPVFLIFSSSVA